MKTRILILVLMFTGAVSFAQQDAQYTQYMYNTIVVNPAYAGSRGVMSIFGLYRAQWIGLDGAPTSSSFSVNTPIKNSNLGIGISFLNDQIGPSVENSISADVSYTIKTSETYKLSFGVKGTGNFFNLDANMLNPENPNDANLQSFNEFSPNIGAGVYFHSDKLYLGLSAPNLIESKHYDDNEAVILVDQINYYFMAGYVFDLSPSIKFKPALLTKMVQGAPLQADISGNFMFNEKFVLGAAYRWDAAVSAMAGFQITDGLYIGYGYDMDTTNLQNYNSGSHEVFLRFELFKNFNKFTTPRFF